MKKGCFVFFLSKDSPLMATVRQLEYLQLFILRLSLSLLSHLLLLFATV